jgi:dTDP-4-dehydrorhamnose 3,5-epimerase
MIFNETELPGTFLIEPERLEDERGFFARTYDRSIFQEYGLVAEIAQCSISFNGRKGTLRGLHYQASPFSEDKLVRCTRGAIHDVIVDLRQDSPTHLRYVGVSLTAENRSMLYVPKGFAHGFLTLADDTEVAYQMSTPYSPEHARGVRWDDPLVGIRWPEEARVISARDRTLPDYEP